MAKFSFRQVQPMAKSVIFNYKQKGFRRFFQEDVLQSNGSPKVKAQSVALGTFLAFSPFLGFQTLLAGVLSFAFRLNTILVLVFCYITLPPFIPFIMYGQTKLGAWLLGKNVSQNFDDFSVAMVGNYMAQYVFGSLLTAFVFAGLLGLIFYWIFNRRAISTKQKAIPTSLHNGQV